MRVIGHTEWGLLLSEVAFTNALRTSNEEIDHRNLKIGTDMAGKICLGRT